MDAVAGEGRAVDWVAAKFVVSWPTPPGAHRLLLLRGYNTLSERGKADTGGIHRPLRASSGAVGRLRHREATADPASLLTAFSLPCDTSP